MKTMRLAIVVFGILGLSKTHASATETYQATLLHPPGYFTSSGLRISGSSQVGGGRPSENLPYHALLWHGTPASVIDLGLGMATDVWGTTQVGNSCCGDGSALLWHGSAESVINLHPPGFSDSYAVAATENTQVGNGYHSGRPFSTRALMWRGTPESVVVLHPAGFLQSEALDAFGDTQVGSGNMAGEHALMWQGTAESVVDLHPSGFFSSVAQGAGENSQVGYGVVGVPSGSMMHALLWHGSAASVVNLHPAGFRSSQAFDVAGNTQVGIGILNNDARRALLWRDTAESVVNLHQFLTGLGIPFVGSSAHGVDIRGDVVGSVIDANGIEYAVKWTLVPEPATLPLLLTAAIGIGAALRRTARKEERPTCID